MVGWEYSFACDISNPLCMPAIAKGHTSGISDIPTRMMAAPEAPRNLHHLIQCSRILAVAHQSEPELPLSIDPLFEQGVKSCKHRTLSRRREAGFDGVVRQRQFFRQHLLETARSSRSRKFPREFLPFNHPIVQDVSRAALSGGDENVSLVVWQVLSDLRESDRSPRRGTCLKLASRLRK